SAAPTRRACAQGRRASSQMTPSPIHAGQCQGASRRQENAFMGAIVSGPPTGPAAPAGRICRMSATKPPALVYPLHSRIKLVLLRWLYTVIMYLATPLIVYRLFVRGLKLRSYLHRWSERFGYFRSPGFQEESIWVHAVSVGEINAAIPLITALRERYRDWPMVVTTVTPTGSERLRQVLGDSLF